MTADVVEVEARTSVLGLLVPKLLPRTLTVWGIFAINLFTVYLITSWIPTLLMSVGWTQTKALHGAADIQFGALVGGLFIATLASRGRLREGLACALLAGAVCLALFWVIAPSVALWTTLLILVGGGTAGTQFALNGLASAVYPAAIRATGHGWALVIGRLAAIAAPMVGGWLIHLQVTPSHLLGFLAIPAGCCALLAMQVRRTWLVH